MWKSAEPEPAPTSPEIPEGQGGADGLPSSAVPRAQGRRAEQGATEAAQGWESRTNLVPHRSFPHMELHNWEKQSAVQRTTR